MREKDRVGNKDKKGAELINSPFFSDANKISRLLQGGTCSRGARAGGPSCAYGCSRYFGPCDCQHAFIEAGFDF